LAAEKTGVKLLLAGRLDKSQKNYFKEKIKPHLGKQIKYVGELSQKEMPGFYRKAKGCLYLLRWKEPFRLVMVEPMAYSTPVIAFDKGSVAEVVKDSKTSFIVKNPKEMVKAIKKIDQIDRKECKK